MGPAKSRWMTIESGPKWIPNHTGKQNVIMLDGDVTNKAFTDADQDGGRTLRMCHFGPGDTVQLQTRVYVERQPDGTKLTR